VEYVGQSWFNREMNEAARKTVEYATVAWETQQVDVIDDITIVIAQFCEPAE
jgi:hypothetical protein